MPKVPAGPAKIIVLSPRPGPAMDMRQMMQNRQKGFEGPIPLVPFRGDLDKWFPLPDKYKEFDTSGLTLTVTRGVNERDIPLD